MIKSRLYNTIIKILSQHKKWLDVRHAFTLAWMIVGLIRSECGNHALYLALDTSRLFEQYCLIRISAVFRSRAVPVVWKVIEHKSSTVAYEVYKELLDAADRVLPKGVRIVFLADRGFADTSLMGYVKELGWHFRIRIKSNFLVYREGTFSSVDEFPLQPGEVLFLNHVHLTGQKYGLVHLALGYSTDGKEKWYVASDEPASIGTFNEYGFRFDIEENFLDDKSNGFQLESSKECFIVGFVSPPGCDVKIDKYTRQLLIKVGVES